MHNLAIIIGALALAVTGICYLRTRREIGRIAQAIHATPELAKGVSTPADLPDAVARLVAENARLRRQFSDQLAQLDATFGRLQEAVMVIAPDNTIRMGNKAFFARFPDATPGEGRRYERAIHSAAFIEYVNAVRNGDAPPLREIVVTQNAADATGAARELWLEVSGANIPSADGSEGEWALFVLHDITTLKRLEAVRRDFVANVSHELRTPLSVIKGFAETLVDGGAEMPAADRMRFLQTILRHSERLATLLNDLLTLSRLESADAGLRREPVLLESLLKGFLEEFRRRPGAKDRTISEEIESGIGELQLDPVKITQVFENLFDNALKYTPAGSPLHLRACLRHSAGGDEVEVSLRDHGTGIPAADLPHLFERFYRVDKGRSRETGGTGLGLSIVKHIVQLHGGRIGATSQLGQGSVFTVVLPK